MTKFLTVLIAIVTFNCCLAQNDDRLIFQIDSLHGKGMERLRDSGGIYFSKAQKRLTNLKSKDYNTTYTNINDVFFLSHYVAKKDQFAVDSLISMLEPRLQSTDTLIYLFQRERARNFEQNGDLKNALATHLRNLELAKQNKNPFWVGRTHLFLGAYFGVVNNHERALNHKKKAAKIFSDLSDASTYHAEALFFSATNYANLGMIDSALIAIRTSLNIDKEGMIKRFSGKIYNNMSLMHFHEGNIDSAQYYASRVIEVSKKKGDSMTIHQGYSNKATFALAKKDRQNALKFLDTATFFYNAFAKERNLFYTRQFYTNKIEIEANDDVRVANSLKQYDSIVSAIYEARIDEEILELRTSFDREKELARNNTKLLLALGLIGLLGVVGLFLYQQKKYVFQKQALKMQQRLLRSQMNPHFTFNTLAAIRGQVKQNPERGMDYLSKFSKHLRLVLENSLNDYVPLEKEIHTLREYLDLQLMRYPKLFEYTVNLEKEIENFHLFIPPMLFQPLVENCIEHGFVGLDYLGSMNIIISRKDRRFLTCVIKDNGRGLSNEIVKNKKSTSMMLIDDFLKKVTKKGISVVNKSDKNSNLSGVEVHFLIPYKTNLND